LKQTIFIVLALAAIWVLLLEGFSIMSLGTGLLLAVACLWYSRKFLPLERIRDMSFSKIAWYPLYLIGQIYLGGFYVTKIIFLGARIDVVECTTTLRSQTLRTIMAGSITITPGSILIDLVDEKVTAVWLRPKNDPDLVHVKDPGHELKGHLEKQLVVAEKAVVT
jgi:multicomponent Na+:H+ antiporter subunit E